MRKREVPSDVSCLQTQFYSPYDLDDEKEVYRLSTFFYRHMKIGQNGFESRKVQYTQVNARSCFLFQVDKYKARTFFTALTTPT